MLTDSENNMMNPVFSFHLFGGRRFLLLILLLVNIQFTQAVGKSNDALPSEITSSPPQLIISEGTIISGAEQIYISNQKKERLKKTVKRKNAYVTYKKRYRKRQHLFKIAKVSNRKAYIFIGNTTSEESLLLASHSDQQIVIPSQHTITFLLLWTENPTFALAHLLDTFLIKIRKEEWFPTIKLFQKFSRPPPFFDKVIR